MEGFNKETISKKEKPAFLYHASPNRDLEEIGAMAESRRDKTEGAVVFATPDLALASSFLVKWDDRWANLGKINGVPYFVIGDKEKYLENDKGGTIYKLDSSSFDYDPDKGLGENEWTSRDKVKPIEKIDISSALESMVDNGLQVYFIDSETFQNFRVTKTPEAMIEILQKQISENKKLEKNIVEF